MKPLYVPRGRAKEYGDYAVNIYTGCPHRCYYCFAPQVLHREREAFHSRVEPRAWIVEALKKQIERESITDKLVHLCFTCDPYPRGCDDSATRFSKRAETTFRYSQKAMGAGTLTCWTARIGMV